MYALVEGDLQKIPGVYCFRIVFDQQQVRLFVMMSNAHHARMSADRVRYSSAPVMIH